MLKETFRKFDHLYVACVPIMIGALIVGMLCGFAFVGLAIASWLDLIELGADFDDIGPLWLGLGGAGITFGAFFGRWSVFEKKAKAMARIKGHSTSEQPLDRS